MREIALISVFDAAYYDDYDTIVGSIGDWAEVTDEEFDLLHRYIGTVMSDRNVRIIEKVPVKRVPMIVKECIKAAEDYEKKIAEMDAKREKEAADKKRKAAERKAAKQKKELEAYLAANNLEVVEKS